MYKIQSSKYSEIKIIFLLPIIAFLFFAFSQTDNATKNTINIENKILTQKESKFALPIKVGKISSKYGMRIHPFSRKKVMHNGIDIAAPKGTKIFASANGIVFLTGNDNAAGNHIIINHTNGYSTFYSQIETILVDKDQMVTTGELIGKVGSTGLSTAPHLHFEIRKNGKAEDPEEYIDFSRLSK